MEQVVSRTIGQRYELCAEIASGGMATVHLARQVGAAGFARIVAVKRLHERFARDPDFVAMFLDEARLVSRIRHPNVVSTIDVVVEDGELFIVMEYVHGESLIKVLTTLARNGNLVAANGGGLPTTTKTVAPRIAAAILVNTLHGLHDAHEACAETGEPLGVVHRDVSPHNILVGVDGIARVLDFGVAKASQRITSTMEGTLKGKLSYMAPEQLQSDPMDRRTDVYAAAVVLWELLAGQKLFHGPSEGTIVQRILTQPVIAPSINNAGVPLELDAIVLRGLTRDPNGRYATARDMAMAIEQSIQVATPAEVAAFLRATVNSELESRGRIIAAVEARASTRSLQEAALSLRSMATGSASGPNTVREPPAREQPMPARSNNAIQVPSSPPFTTAPPPPMAYGSYSTPPASTLSSRRLRLRSRDSIPPQDDSAKRMVVAVAIAVVTFSLAVGVALIVLARRSESSAEKTANKTAADITSSAAVAPASSSSAPAVITCPEGMAFVPGGKFFMGSDDDLPAEKPAHNVTLHPYCMDKREVTASAYRECSDRGDCKRAGQSNKWDGISAKDSRTFDPLCNIGSTDTHGTHPINCVDWSMADRFCRAAGKRLPTEAEWEFAARGSDGRKFPWGDALPTSKHLNACGSECVSWLRKRGAQNDGFLYSDDDGFATTAPVGSFPAGASRWGIEDMVGNVWEWVSDYYGTYSPEDQSDPSGPTSGKQRVIRGGAWNGAMPDWVRPTFRYESPVDTRSHGIGFRCAK